MTKSKLPIPQRIHHRAMARWPTQPEWALECLVADLEGSRLSVSQLAPLPLPLAEGARRVQAALAQLRAIRRVEAHQQAQRWVEQATVQASLEEQRQADLRVDLAECAPQGRARFLASLDPMDRDAIGEKADRRTAVELRKASAMAGQACAAVSCTRTELDRWDEDGRLPHLFIKRVHIHRMVDCRFWNLGELAAAKEQLEAWREQDRVRKRFKRVGLKPVIISAKRRTVRA